MRRHSVGLLEIWKKEREIAFSFVSRSLGVKYDAIKSLSSIGRLQRD
jgi:hypothetical protein